MNQGEVVAQPFRDRTPPNPSPLPVPTLSLSQRRAPSQPPSTIKNGHLTLDTFSPVNKNGSFEFDRVLRSGKVHRRVKKKGAWKPTWKPVYLVLRPNLLSIYQDEHETGLLDSVTLSDVTAVALVKKTNTPDVFGVFSPSKNYHFQGSSAQDTVAWIGMIRNEAPADSQNGQLAMSPLSPPGQSVSHYYDTDPSADDEAYRSASPEFNQRNARVQEPRSRASTTHRRPSHLNEYSGNELISSHSDFSDTPGGSLPKSMASSLPKAALPSPIRSDQNIRPGVARTVSQVSVDVDLERVIRQGWLQCLRTKGRVRQWKTLWVVLRPKTVAFYKNDKEYSAVKLVSMSSVINAAEIDPISKSKRFCLQIILEDTIFRCCAADEEDLARWLGSLKSVIMKRQEALKQLTGTTAALSV